MDVELPDENYEVPRPAELGKANEIMGLVEYEPVPSEGAIVSEPIAGETTIHRFRFAPELAFGIDPATRRTAEFWLNAGDGDLAVALLLASERLNLAAATASRGFLRGQQLNTARGL